MVVVVPLAGSPSGSVGERQSPEVFLHIPQRPCSSSLLPNNVAFLFVPTRYPGSESSTDGLLRAGGATEWSEPIPGVGIGVGQRVYLHGDATLAAVTLTHVAVASRDGVANGHPGVSS